MIHSAAHTAHILRHWVEIRSGVSAGPLDGKMVFQGGAGKLYHKGGGLILRFYGQLKISVQGHIVVWVCGVH